MKDVGGLKLVPFSAGREEVWAFSTAKTPLFHKVDKYAVDPFALFVIGLTRPRLVVLMARERSQTNQILLFPVASTTSQPLQRETAQMSNHQQPQDASNFGHLGRVRLDSEHASAKYEVVLSGTYRKDFAGLKRTYEELRDLGCKVLSPSNVNAVREVDGFVYMEGEETATPEVIETRHLEAIQAAQFVWLHAPDGYVGPTAALEVGFSRACGIPVFSRSSLSDRVLKNFVEVVDSPDSVLERLRGHVMPPPSPAIRAFQNYYRRVAVEREYHKESARDCLLLMVEEVGELARAIRKRQKLQRHETEIVSSEEQELADVFLYVVHLANILNLDLSSAAQTKEILNLKKLYRQQL